jgi:hypothetical protein
MIFHELLGFMQAIMQGNKPNLLVGQVVFII